jgi:hypothetical protein
MKDFEKIQGFRTFCLVSVGVWISALYFSGRLVLKRRDSSFN